MFGMPAQAAAETSTSPTPPDLQAVNRTPVGGPPPEHVERGTDVEDRSRRTRDSRTFVTPEGLHRTEIYSGSIHYRDGQGQWQEIDNTLVASSESGYAYENAANSYKVAFPADLAAAPIRLSFGDAWISFAPRGATGSPTGQGSTATYADALPGIDAAYTATSDGLKEELTLATADASHQVVFDIEASPGLRIDTDDQGATTVVAPSGERLSIAAPFMYDSADEPAYSSDVSFQLERSDAGFVGTLTADPEWVKAPGRVFPIVIDPQFISPRAAPDCHITSGSAADSSFCSAEPLKVGYDGSQASRALMQFSLGALPPQVDVLNAELGMNLYATSTSNGASVSVHEVSKSWTTAVTWNKRNSTDAWTNAGGDFKAAAYTRTGVGTSTGWQYWYPTEVVQDWVNGRSPNNGLIVKADAETVNNVLSFRSSESSIGKPRLTVEYEPRVGERPFYTVESQQLSDRMSLHANVASGNVMLKASDLAIAGTGIDLSLDRVYNSRAESMIGWSDQWGQGGTAAYEELIKYGDGSVALSGRSAFVIPFIKRSDGTFKSPPAIDATLTRNADATYTLKFHHDEEKHHFSSGGQITSVVDRNGNKISFAYDSFGSVASVTDTQGRVTTFTLNSVGMISSITDPVGRKHTYGYDANDLLTSYTDPTGKITKFAYDSLFALTQITDPNANLTKLAYDSHRRVTSITRVTDAANGTGPTTSFTYNAGNTVVTDPRGNKTTYAFDGMGRVSKTTNALGNATSKTYTSNSNVADYTDADTSKTIFSYNANNNLTKIQAPTGSINTLAYDDASHPHSPTTLTDAQGNTQTHVYDTNGNVASVTNGLASQNKFSYTYNSNGTLASITDSKGNVTSHSYDTKGNLTQISYPSPMGATSFTYDGVSRTTSMTDGKGQKTSYAYDAVDRLTSITYADGATISYSYAANGNLLSRVDNTGTTSFAYDALNRMTKKTLPNGSSITYGYDAAGNLTSLTDGGGSVSYAYDAVNLVSSLTEPSGAKTTFSHDKSYRRTSTAYPNAVTQNATYDASGRMTKIAATNSAGTTLTSFTYSYTDPATGKDSALRQSVTDKNGNKTVYGYDVINRLKRAKTTSSSGTVTEDYQYDYDGNSNITSKTVNGIATSYTYNAANQMTAAGSTTYSYDAAGNQTGNSAGLALSYNAKNQTTSITPSGGSAVSMSYADATQDERVGAGGKTFDYSLLGLTTERDGGTTHYTRDNKGALVAQRGPSATHYYLVDALGSVVGLTDSSGSLAATYRYEPYGKLVSSTGSLSNPWRFAGGYFDSSTGFYKFGTRYYDPNVGRWTQPDPVSGCIDQPESLNPYVYVNSNPVNATDESGRFSFSCWLQCVTAACSRTVLLSCQKVLRVPIIGSRLFVGCVIGACGAWATWCVFACP